MSICFIITLKTLNTFLKKYDLEIFDFELSPIHGGQVVAYISHKGGKIINRRLQNALFKEKNIK